MGYQEQFVNEKFYQRHIKEILPYLEKNKIMNISDHLISSHIKNVWDDKVNKKENYRNIIKNIISEHILKRRRQILLHSCIYYKFDMSIIMDCEFDRICQELIYLQERFTNISKETPLYSVFEDWGEGGLISGYKLPYENQKVVDRAQRIIDLNRWYTRNG